MAATMSQSLGHVLLHLLHIYIYIHNYTTVCMCYMNAVAKARQRLEQLITCSSFARGLRLCIYLRFTSFYPATPKSNEFPGASYRSRTDWTCLDGCARNHRQNSPHLPHLKTTQPNQRSSACNIQEVFIYPPLKYYHDRVICGGPQQAQHSALWLALLPSQCAVQGELRLTSLGPASRVEELKDAFSL